MRTEPPCCILLTGVTGFLGKVVLEELIRRRHEYTLDKILVLLRPGIEKNAQQRFVEEVASSKCFENLPGKWVEYVDIVAGDLIQPDCGIEEKLYRVVCSKTTHIINCAACVSFDLPLAEAAKANVSTALNLLGLAKSCHRLQGMVTTSTAYVAPHTNGPIQPILTPLPYPAEILYQSILAGKMDEAALLRKTRHPNTYTLTKCLAEHMFLQHKDKVPLTIVRPSIISCSWKYPFPGWIDSKAAVAGFIALIGAGYLRVVDGRKEAILDVVPVDVVANDIIKEARLIPSPPPLHNKNNPSSTGSRPCQIIHSVAGVKNGLPIGLIASQSVSYFQKLTSDQYSVKNASSARKPKLTYLGERSLNFHLHDLLWHRLPLGLAGLCFRITGNEKMARKTRSLSTVLKKINRIFPYYTHHTFDFEMGRGWTDSIGEQEGADINAENHLNVILEGVRTNLLKM